MSINSVKYRGNLGSELAMDVGNPNYVLNDPFVGAISPNKGLSLPNTSTITLVSRKTNFAPNTLGTTTKVYTSPLVSDIQNLANFYADFGCSYEINTGPVYTMTVTIPFDEISEQDYYINQAVLENWEIVPTSGQKPLASTNWYLNPSLSINANGNMYAFPDPVKAAIYYAYNNQASTIIIPQSGSVSYAGYLPFAQQVLSMMRAGITHTPSWTQTIKRSAIIDLNNSNNSFNTQGDVSFKNYTTNLNRNTILSKTEMISNYTIPRVVQNLMYPSYSKVLSVVSSTSGVQQDSGASVIVTAGYMVQPITYQYITKNKIQLAQNFVWDEWVSGLYYVPGYNSYYPIIAPSAF